MRVLILDTLYKEFYESVYARNPQLQDAPSEEQQRVIYDHGFARADFLARNFRKLGHEATQILLNVSPLTRKIAAELHLPVPADPMGLLGRTRQRLRSVRRKLGSISISRADQNLLYAQIEGFRPDVILNADVMQVPARLFRPLKKAGLRVIGECAYPIPPRLNLTDYDAMLSALPSYVDRFRGASIRTMYWPHAFEPDALTRIEGGKETDGVVFVGTVSKQHLRRLEILERLAERFPLRLFGTTPHGLSKHSPLKGKFQPALWGYEMLRALARAKVALNIHAELAGGYAVNIRLFETTGVGTLLLTDFKDNLSDFFEIGREVVAFHHASDCLVHIEHYLENDAERQRIARAGQARTLRDHTYQQRVTQLLSFLER